MERMEINLSIMTKDQLKKFIVELDKENKKLEEENRKLKIDIGGVMGERDGARMTAERLEEENRILKELIRGATENIKELKEKLNEAGLEEYGFFNEYGPNLSNKF